MLIVSIIIIGYQVPIIMTNHFDKVTKQSQFNAKSMPADEKEISNVEGGEMVFNLNKDFIMKNKEDASGTSGEIKSIFNKQNILYKPTATFMRLGNENHRSIKATSSGEQTRLRPVGSLMRIDNGSTGFDIRHPTIRQHSETMFDKQTSAKRSGNHIRVSNFEKPKSIDNGNIGLDEYHSFNRHQASIFDKNLLAKRGGGGGAHKVCRKKPTTITKCMDRIVYGRKVRFCVYKKAFRCTSVDRFKSLFMIVV